MVPHSFFHSIFLLKSCLHLLSPGNLRVLGQAKHVIHNEAEFMSNAADANKSDLRNSLQHSLLPSVSMKLYELLLPSQPSVCHPFNGSSAYQRSVKGTEMELTEKPDR